MPHVDEQTLAALALDDVGDLPAEAVAEARAHLAECEQCSEEADAFAGLLVLAAGRAETLTAPPPQVWQGVLAGIEADLGTDADSAEPARTRDEGEVVDLRRRRTVPTWLASVAAATALILGVGGGMLLGGDDAPPTADPTVAPAVVASTQLASLDEAADDRGTAEVRRHDDRVVLHVSPRDLEGPDGIREVWLINVDGARMVSLGLLTPTHSGDFEFPEELLDEGYRIVDISYEPDDGNPVHSGQSLARGTIEG